MRAFLDTFDRGLKGRFIAAFAYLKADGQSRGKHIPDEHRLMR